MYQDINGKTGHRNLQGSTYQYGNLKLLNPTELAAALADGITDFVAPVKPLPTAQYLENQRRRSIRAATNDRLEFSVVGELAAGDERIASTLIDILFALVTLTQDLSQKGLILPSEYSTPVKNLKATAALMRTARQASRAAIQAGDTLEEWTVALDSILPPPTSPL